MLLKNREKIPTGGTSPHRRARARQESGATNAPADVIAAWLQLQCRAMDGTIRAVVLLGESNTGPFGPVAQWPDGATATPALATAATRAVRERSTVVLARDRAPDSAQQTGDIVACPILSDKRILGVVAIEFGAGNTERQVAAAKALETNTATLELLMRTHAQQTDKHTRDVLELVAASVEHATFDAASRSLTSRFATIGGFEQVSLGIVRGDRTEVVAASGRASVDARMQFSRCMGLAMDEAIEQDATRVLAGDPANADAAHAAHAELARQRGDGAICTVPIAHDGELVGAMLFARDEDQRLDDATIAFCETAVALIGPILYQKFRQDRSPAEKAASAFRSGAASLLAPGNRWRGVIATAVVALCAAPFFVTGHYRVTADASLEGSVQRVVAAPVDGFVAQAPARPGDVVDEGQLLARLDDRELELERVRLDSEKKQLQREYREAMAELDSTRVTILKARLDRATAKLGLTEERLARTHITAPMAGVVVEGDLSQSLGAPVEKGQPLFQIAPLDEYRVMLRVDEREIGHIATGQTGRLALVGLPDRYLPFRVERITPIAAQADGRNFFSVEARLEDSPALLRPGMDGVGKIDVGERRLAWIWMHPLVDWLRLQAWTWSG